MNTNTTYRPRRLLSIVVLLILVLLLAATNGSLQAAFGQKGAVAHPTRYHQQRVLVKFAESSALYRAVSASLAESVAASVANENKKSSHEISTNAVSTNETSTKEASTNGLPTAFPTITFNRTNPLNALQSLASVGVVSLQSLELVSLSAVRNTEHLANVAAASSGIEQLFLAELQQGSSVERAVTELSVLDGVEYAEPDYRGSCAAVPNDPSFGSQWGLRNTGQIIGGVQGYAGADANVAAAWDVTTGSAATILAIIDSGILPGAASRADYNGRIVQGYDFVNKDNDPTDDYGHGSHVTSIAAATGNDGSAMAGVNWRCRIMPLKTQDSDGEGWYSAWISALRYAADNGAKVVNMSVGGSAASNGLRDALVYAASKGVIVVVSMGNDGNAVARYPANYDNVIAIGSTTNRDARSSFSSFGSHIDFVAPGTGITGMTNTGSVELWSGTSMASPIAAGIVSLLVGVNPALTFAQVYDALKAGARDRVGAANEDMSGFDVYFGWGRLDALRSLQAINASIVSVVQPAYSIAGSVLWRGAGLSGVGVTLAGTGASIGTSKTTTTDAAGNYSFSGLVNGSYTITAARAGFTINPTSRSVSVAGASLTGQTFMALGLYAVSGTVSISGGQANTTAQGITLSLLTLGSLSTQAASATVTAQTDSFGRFVFANIIEGSYTLTAAKAGLMFSPSTQNLALTTNVTNLAIAATPVYAVRGLVMNASGVPMANASLRLTSTTTGLVAGSAKTDASGVFVFANVVSSGYKVSVDAVAGVVFSPSERIISVSSFDVAEQNFRERGRYSVFGRITRPDGTGIGGVSVSVGDSTAVTDATGMFLIASMLEGEYSVVPRVAAGQSTRFMPTSRTVTVAGRNTFVDSFVADVPSMTTSIFGASAFGSSAPGSTVNDAGTLRVTPNPADDIAFVSYDVPIGGVAQELRQEFRIVLLNALGQEVLTVLAGKQVSGQASAQASGQQTISFSTESLAAGVYQLVLQTPTFTRSVRLVKVR